MCFKLHLELLLLSRVFVSWWAEPPSHSLSLIVHHRPVMSPELPLMQRKSTSLCLRPRQTLSPAFITSVSQSGRRSELEPAALLKQRLLARPLLNQHGLLRSKSAFKTRSQSGRNDVSGTGRKRRCKGSRTNIGNVKNRLKNKLKQREKKISSQHFYQLNNKTVVLLRWKQLHDACQQKEVRRQLGLFVVAAVLRRRQEAPNLRQAPRFSFVVRVCRAMRVPCRKQRSSKTTRPSRGPRCLPRPHSVRLPVCCGKIKRKHKLMIPTTTTTTTTTGAKWVGTGVGAGRGCGTAPEPEQRPRNLPGNPPAFM